MNEISKRIIKSVGSYPNKLIDLVALSTEKAREKYREKGIDRKLFHSRKFRLCSEHFLPSRTKLNQQPF